MTERDGIRFKESYICRSEKLRTVDVHIIPETFCFVNFFFLQTVYEIITRKKYANVSALLFSAALIFRTVQNAVYFLSDGFMAEYDYKVDSTVLGEH